MNTAHGLPRNALCALCLLFVHSLLFNPGGSKGKEEFIFIESFVFLSLPRKTSAASACSAVDFSLSLEGAETFIIS
jgi:hypothetical protein